MHGAPQALPCSCWDAVPSGNVPSRDLPAPEPQGVAPCATPLCHLPVLHTQSSAPRHTTGENLSVFFLHHLLLPDFFSLIFFLFPHPKRVDFCSHQAPHFPWRPGQSCPMEGKILVSPGRQSCWVTFVPSLSLLCDKQMGTGAGAELTSLL